MMKYEYKYPGEIESPLMYKTDYIIITELNKELLFKVFEYCYEGTIPTDLTNLELAVFNSTISHIESAWRSKVNGKKGGVSRGVQRGVETNKNMNKNMNSNRNILIQENKEKDEVVSSLDTTTTPSQKIKPIEF